MPRRSQLAKRLVWLVWLLTLGATVSAQAQDRWQFRVTPYLWTMALKGDTNLGGIPIDVDESVTDVLRQLDFAIQFNVEARTGNVIIIGDSHFASLTKDLDFPPGSFTTRQAIVSAAAGYRFAERYDLYAGVRYHNVRSESDFVGFPNLSGDGQWVDPLVGGRVRVPLGERLAFALRGDVGGFGVGSKVGWMIQPTVTWTLNSTVSFLAGYRHLYVDYETGSGQGFYAYKVHHTGPGIGVDLRF
jgi:hypothetical protein